LDKSNARIRQAKAQNKRIKENYFQVAEIFNSSFTSLQTLSPVINQVISMKNNVSQLNKTLKHFVNLGEKVNTLIDDLNDSKKILDVYKQLIILIKLRKSFIAKLKDPEQIKTEDNKVMKLSNMEKELSGIKELENKFVEKMHGFMEKHQFIIQKQPAHFVKIMRIIECDRKIAEKGPKEKHALLTITEEVEGKNQFP
jgi:hypothetical protein